MSENLYLPFDGTIQQKFEEFHAKHPEVYSELVKRAREVAARGKRCGVKTLYERMRWFFWVEMDEAEEFKLNNNYTSRYARLIEEQEADLKGFFDTRELRAA